ncbi:MAG: hypothetical protein K6B67_08520 [Lachnospiraceae bacterium]|nr:hypothetical protein [Lachnospiraceae bacterium]
MKTARSGTKNLEAQKKKAVANPKIGNATALLDENSKIRNKKLRVAEEKGGSKAQNRRMLPPY